MELLPHAPMRPRGIQDEKSIYRRTADLIREDPVALAQTLAFGKIESCVKCFVDLDHDLTVRARRGVCWRIYPRPLAKQVAKC